MKNDIKIPFLIESLEDIEMLIAILESDIDKELTNKELSKRFIKRKREVIKVDKRRIK